LYWYWDSLPINLCDPQWPVKEIALKNGNGPFDFIVTAIDGQEIREENVAYRPGDTVQGTDQFLTD
jgi:hypothetical protein